MSDVGTDEVFGQSGNLKAAVAIMNEVAANKFPKLLQRVLEKLHLKDEKPFSREEEEALLGALDIDAEKLSLLLNTVSYIFETAVYHQLEAQMLVVELKKIELSADRALVVGQLWSAKGAATVSKIRDAAFFDSEMMGVNWRLHVALATSAKAKAKTPLALFEVGVKSRDGKGEKLQMEFNHAELFRLYTKLEIIQDQLDALN